MPWPQLRLSLSGRVGSFGRLDLRRRASRFLLPDADGRVRLLYGLDGRGRLGHSLGPELLGVLMRIDQRRLGGGEGRLRRVGSRLVGFRLNPHLWRGQQWMREFDRRHFLRRDDDALADLGQSPKFGGEPGGEPDATVRGRMTGNDAEMHGDARPCDALHERHRCGRVDIRAMVSLAADYGEHALGRRMAEHASRNRRAVDEPVLIVYGDALVSDRNNSKQRPLAVIDFGALRPWCRGRTAYLRAAMAVCSACGPRLVDVERRRVTPRPSRRRLEAECLRRNRDGEDRRKGASAANSVMRHNRNSHMIGNLHDLKYPETGFWRVSARMHNARTPHPRRNVRWNYIILRTVGKRARLPSHSRFW